MHATHQFFMTQRSLYLLVLNAREGEQDANIEYWLRLIESFGGNSPVIVVINQIKQHQLDLNQRGLKEKFPAIREFIETDCESTIGFDALRHAIERETDRLEHVHDRFPINWFMIKDRLANLKENLKENYITYERYRALCIEQGEIDAKNQDTLVKFLHDLGIVVNFREDPRLADTHILDPEWVTNGIYKILNNETLAKVKTGELHLVTIRDLLDENAYPRTMHRFLLDLMGKFELCYEFYNGQGEYLVPELLGKDEPDSQAFTGTEALRFEYHYNILPEGLVPRFIVRSRILNKDLPRWRTGAMLTFEGNRALVKADVQDKKVSIAVTGNAAGRRRLLSVIRSDFEDIHRSITKLKAEEKVPVPGHPGVVVDYQLLRALEEKGRQEHSLLAGGKLIDIKVTDLLNGVEDASQRQRAIPLEAIREVTPVQVVFSYSHKDEELRDQLETHLKLMQRQGIINTWHDRKIAAGEEWRDTIDDNFRRADVILLLTSADFLASDYCYDIEVKSSLERHDKGEARVVPIILRKCDWQGAPFGKLQALPRDDKAVTLWKDRDEAWHSVAEGIKKVAEEIRQGQGLGGRKRG
jgi:internalin A